MEKVVLSKGYEFELPANPVTESGNQLMVTFFPGEETLETLEAKWEGNDLIQIVHDDEKLMNCRGYLYVKSLSKINDYVIGGVTEEGDDIKATVFQVVLNKADMEQRIADLEDSTADIINTILG